MSLPDIPDELITPPPITRVSESMDQVPDLPGEIKVDESGRLLKQYLTIDGFSLPMIQAYNQWLTTGIQKQLDSYPIMTPSGKRVTMHLSEHKDPEEKVRGFLKPRDRSGPMYPQRARDNDLTYATEMKVDLVLERPQPGGWMEEKRLPNCTFGLIPVMLGSVICHLHGKSERERLTLGECSKDPLGYFVVKGAERIVIIQEKLRKNRIFLFNDTKRTTKPKIKTKVPEGKEIKMSKERKQKSNVVCQMTADTNKGTTTLIRLSIGSLNVIQIRFSFNAQPPKDINVLRIFRLLGMTDLQGIRNTISYFVKPEYMKKVMYHLNPTFFDLQFQADDVDYISKEYKLDMKIPYEARHDKIRSAIRDFLFPKIGLETHKVYELALMVAYMAEFLAGVRPLDDRDSWSNKRLETAPVLMSQLFIGILSKMIKDLQETVRSKNLEDIESIYRMIQPRYITDNFITSFSSNNWGVQGLGHVEEAVTDYLKRESALSVYSHLTRIKPKAQSQSKQTALREVHMSALGYVCPVETPEGDQCTFIEEPVLCPNNKTTSMGNLKNGDEVITIDPSTLKQSITTVTKHFVKPSTIYGKKVVSIRTINGRELKCTEDHPFLTNNGWKQAGQLKPLQDYVCIFSNTPNPYQTEYERCSEISHKEFQSHAYQVEQCVFIHVQSITEEQPCDVGDFTTQSDTHTFVANGFVTHNCGMVKNLAITCFLSLERDENLVWNTISEGKYITEALTETNQTLFLLNGMFRGWCAGEDLRNFCLTQRRTGVFYKDTGIVLVGDINSPSGAGSILYVNTDASRPTRPLLIVDTGGELIWRKYRNIWNEEIAQLNAEGKRAEADEKRNQANSWATYMKYGMVEYIDAFEQEFIQLASSVWDLEAKRNELKALNTALMEAQVRYARRPDEDSKREVDQAQDALNTYTRKQPYTHCELNPSAILGISASIIPNPERQPGPRSTFQCLSINEKVVMSNGSLRKMKDIRNSDSVMTVNPVTMEQSPSKIYNHFLRWSEEVYKVTTLDGRSVIATRRSSLLDREWVERS